VIAGVKAPPADEEQAVKVLSEEIQRLATAPVTYRDYRSAVSSAVGALLIRQQDRLEQIGDVIKSVLTGTGIDAFQEYTSRLQDVKQTDLQEVSQRIFKAEKSVTLRFHGKTER
jgi:predicted Zn-dependent peptidase